MSERGSAHAQSLDKPRPFHTIKLFGILDGGALEVLLCCLAASAAAAAASCSFFAALSAALLLVRGTILGGNEMLLGRGLSFGFSASSGAGEGEAVSSDSLVILLPLVATLAVLLALVEPKGRVTEEEVDCRETDGGLPG